MITVREVMSTPVAAISPELTLRHTLELLAEQHIGGAPVVAAGRVVGVISASDVLSFEAETPGVPTGRTDEVEQGELASAEQWEEGDEAPAAFFVETWSDAGADVAERMHAFEGPEWDLLEDHTVAEAMTAPVLSIGPDASIVEAARLMAQRGIHRLLVLEKGRLVGILTTMDLVRALAGLAL